MMRATGAVVVCAIAWSACTIEPRTDRVVEDQAEDSSSVFIRPWPGVPPAGVRSGDLVWIWGMTGTAPGTTTVVDGGAPAETRQALENVLDVLEGAGALPQDVAQCSIFVADSADLAAVRDVYSEYFATPPRRAGVAFAGLGGGARVELECTAVVTAAP